MKTLAGALTMLLQVSAAATLSAKEVPVPIPADRAVKAIIGEAENQGPKGMLAVACVIRNRGGVKGMCGYFAIEGENWDLVRVSKKGVRRIPKEIVLQAKRAWALSAKKDITNGATHFENVAAFGVPDWARDMKRVYEYEGHVFFQANPTMSKMSKGV